MAMTSQKTRITMKSDSMNIKQMSECKKDEEEGQVEYFV